MASLISLPGLVRVLLLAAGILLATGAWAESGKLRLAEPLDREYCLDVSGAGDTVMLWKPLIAHNCKQGDWADERILWSSDGPIRFPAYDRCVTAAGVKHATLPGSALLLRQCRSDEPLQRFRHREDGRVEQADSGLCLAVGPHSTPTWNPDYRWRRLSLEDCEGMAPNARSGEPRHRNSVSGPGGLIPGPQQSRSPAWIIGPS